MPSIRKARGKWLAEVRLKGFYDSKTFPNKIEAQAWAFELERSLGKHGHIPTDYTLGEAFDKYSREISPGRKGCRWEQVRLKKLKRHSFADIKLAHLTTEDIQSWVSDQLETLAPGSIRRELNLIGAVLEAARKRWKWHDRQPLKDVERPQKPAGRDRRISRDEIARVLAALGHAEDKPPVLAREEAAFGFLIALETAMRAGEIWGLEWERVHLKERYVALEETKNGTRRNVALSRRAVELLQKLGPRESGKVFKRRQASTLQFFRRAVKKAKIEEMTFHDTRHEALTNLARKLDVLDLARMVGHKDPRSLMIYYNATASEIAGRLD